MGGRIRWAIVLAAVALAAMVTSGPAVAADGASVTTVPGGPLFGELVPGPDGALWHVEQTPETPDEPPGARVVRVGADATSGPTLEYWPIQGVEPHVLPDGSMGLLMATFDGRTDGWVADGRVLLRLTPGGGVVAPNLELPSDAEQATVFAFAPDGAVWFADSCGDRLGRVAPNGYLSYVRLPRIGCRKEGGTVERGAVLTLDSKGALWFVNLCVGRIDRVSLAGRVREWRALRVGCDSWEGVRTAVAADPRGGIFFTASGSENYGSGRVRRGRLQRFVFSDNGVFTPDGALWRVLPGAIERRGPDGSIRIRGTGRVRPVSNLVPAPGGGVAVVLATYWRSDPNYDTHNPRVGVDAYLDGRVVVLQADGSETSWPLPDGGTDAPSQLSDAYLALGPDGAFYVRELRVAGSDFARSLRLLRLVPDDLAPPRPPAARVRAVLGRVGRVAWLQLSCAAELARFCLGTVRLKGKGVPNPARFALAGRSRGAVPVALGEQVQRLLRQREKLRMVAEVRTDDGTVTRSRVTIGSNAPQGQAA
jgi:virginiamycin B lyase